MRLTLLSRQCTETILHLWGDTWSGWLVRTRGSIDPPTHPRATNPHKPATQTPHPTNTNPQQEDELKALWEAGKRIPLATYLRILLAPLTADFTDAALLLGRCARSLGQAWQQREKTQFIQALGNLLNIGFDRALAPVEGLADARELLARRALVDAREGGLRSSLDLSLSLSASNRRLPRQPAATTATTTTAAAGTGPAASATAASTGGASHGGGQNGGGRRRPPSLNFLKLPKAVFRGRSDGTRAAATAGAGREEGGELGDGDDDGSVEDEEGGTWGDDDEDLAGLVGAASRVRVHHTVLQYAREMLEEGVLEDVMAFVRADPRCRVIVTGWVPIQEWMCARVCM